MEETFDGDPSETATLEAYADTIVPGEKRWPGDRAIAGVSAGGGAVAAGAVELMRTDAGGLAPALPDLVRALNAHAEAYRDRLGLERDDSVPAFVALSGEHRVALVSELVAPGHPEKMLWVGMAIFSNMAFDVGAHLHTSEAMASGHPGLAALGYFQPDPDGLWRFPDFSYRRPLADHHPDTTPSGSPA
ncbi:DUF5987 family protein [Catenulispora yoronensis]|uniref:DUF5987 family protein n=1 Tax=Catenulispora yoronensis TaxID=450799 RepID=A0ABN2V7N2_9ACTN